MNHVCIVCGGKDFGELYAGKIINGHILNRCENCGMVLAFSVDGLQKYDFSNYGDYLILNEKEISKRVKYISKRMQHIFYIISNISKTPMILDFGCGAGFFCKAAQKFGINVYGVEESDKLRKFINNNLNLKNIYRNIDDIDKSFDAVFMFDVIEHLNPSISRNIMKKIMNHLKPGGLLIGNAPNFKSANILICKEKDPVIWPPSHTSYFTLETLDKYLSTFGLQRIKLYSKGLSTNSFFRRNKFEKSFLEKSIRNIKLGQIPFHIAAKIIFNMMGIILQPFGLGYQIHFMYKYKTAKPCN